MNATDQYIILSWKIYMFFHNAATRWWKPYGKSVKYKLLSSAFLWLFVYCTKILKSEHFSERYLK